MESKTAVVAAMAANLAIAATKGVAAALSGSSSMLSESIHSVVDTADQLLLLLGLHRAARPADAAHPFGHGRELYFWTLLVAIVIFGVGGGMSIYEGVTRLRARGPVESATLSYAVLGASALFEGISWTVGYRGLKRRRPDRSLWRAFKETKDPSILTVVVEDSAALAGLAVAFAGVFVAQRTGDSRWDAAGAIAIGLLLCVVAVLLARESKSLLVGEAADPGVVARIREVARASPAVERVGDVHTMHLAPAEVLVVVDVTLRPSLSVGEGTGEVERLREAIRAEVPQATRVLFAAAPPDDGARPAPRAAGRGEGGRGSLSVNER